MKKNIRNLGVISALLLIFTLSFLLTSCSVNNDEEKSYEINDEFCIILIDTDCSDITFLPSTDGKCRVNCSAIEGIYHSVKVNGDKLQIELDDDRSFFERMLSLSKNNSITVYLPLDVYTSVIIDNDTGDVKLHSDFVFDHINIDADTGDVVCNSSAAYYINIESDTGNIVLNDNSAAEYVNLKTYTGSIIVKSGNYNDFYATTETGDIVVSYTTCKNEFKTLVDTGDVDLSNITCGSFISVGDTGELTLSSVVAEEMITIKRETGGVRFNKCDAAEIEISTDTGNVTGSLLSNKMFTVNTDTGRVDLPESEVGGKCKIFTSTGDIKITVEK